MDIHHLKVFAYVYKHKSFTRASEELHISQPTISEHIKNLEISLECRLFDRMGRSIMPTVEADVLYPKALQLLDDLEMIKEEISAASTGVKGKLYIGASTIPGTYILPRSAYSFKNKFPDVAFEILMDDSSKINSMIIQHELLCGIVGAKVRSEKLDYYPLIEDELILVAAPNIVSAKSISPEKLASLPFLQREEGSGTRQTFENYLEQGNISRAEFKIVATLGSTSSIKQAVIEGLGAAVISRIAVQEDLANKKLLEIKIRNLRMKRSFYLVRQKKRSLPAQYHAFIKHLKETIS
jgi:DNA-binding transcriptional LysR family regulator